MEWNGMEWKNNNFNLLLDLLSFSILVFMQSLMGTHMTYKEQERWLFVGKENLVQGQSKTIL